MEEYQALDSFADKKRGGGASVVSTVMNLLNSLLGAGVLSTPNSFIFCGFVPSFCMLLFIAILSYISAVLVEFMRRKMSASSYAEIASRALGKWGSVVLSTGTMLFCYSCMIAYIIISTDIMCTLAKLFSVTIHPGMERSILLLVSSLLIPVALTVPRKVGVLSVISTVSVFCIFIYVLAMIVKGIQILPPQGISRTCDTANVNSGVFNAIGVYSLAFALALIEIPILAQSEDKYQTRTKILSWTFWSCYLIVMVPSVIGYLIFGADSAQVILESFPPNDVLMTIVRIMFLVIVNASYPMLGLTVASILSRTIYGKDDHNDLDAKKRSVVLLLENLPPLFIAILLPNVRPILAIGGAFGGCLCNMAIPGLIYFLKSGHNKTHWKSILGIVFSIFGLAMTVISTYTAVMDAISTTKV